jgi:elongator complex protein 2
MFRVFDNRIPCLSIEQAIERIQPLNLTPKQPSNTDNSTTTQNGLEINTNAPLNEELLQCGATVHEEKRKLYGHGNECYAVVTSPDYSLTFTAAKGSRPDESQLLVWRVEGWKLEQRLTDHTLTITAMSVSSDGRWLLTVSRDRSFAVYEILQNSQSEPLRLKVHQKQAHKRVIWDCAWIPNSSKFVTGSRDGVVGLFEVENNADQVKELQKWTVGECVSALSVGERLSDG